MWESVSLETLEHIHELSNLFIKDLEKIVSKFEYTINIHSLSHLALIVLLFGPLKYINAFVFEHFIGKIKNYINSPYGVNEQIRKDYTLDFFLKINNEKVVEKEDVKYLGKHKKKKKNFIEKL